MFSRSVIISAARTAIGTFGGSLKDVPVSELGRVVIENAIDRAGLDRGDIDEVIMGNVLQAGAGDEHRPSIAICSGHPRPAFRRSR